MARPRAALPRGRADYDVDAARQRAFEQGRRQAREGLKASGGEPLTVPSRVRLEDPELDEAHEAGFSSALGESERRAGRAERTPARSRGSRTASTGQRLLQGARDSVAGGFVEEGAGLLLGLLAWALVLAYFRGGPAAVKGWLAAKFLNKPYKPATSTPAAPGLPSPSPGPALGPSAGSHPAFGALASAPLPAFNPILGAPAPGLASSPGGYG